MTVNQELFNKIADVIEMEPDAYYQGDWACFSDDSVYCQSAEEADAKLDKLEHLCGTEHCIAGWAIVLTAKEQGLLSVARAERYGFVQYSDGEINVSPLDWLRGLADRTAGVAAEVTMVECDEDFVRAGATLLGLERKDAYYLFNGGWSPESGLSVPEALRKIGGGANVHDV